MMTGIELFEKHAGSYVQLRKTSGSEWDTSTLYRICGYAPGSSGYTVLEADVSYAAPAIEFKKANYLLLDGLPESWRGSAMPIDFLDLNSIVSMDPYQNLCCKCGRDYENKRDHRKVCGK